MSSTAGNFQPCRAGDIRRIMFIGDRFYRNSGIARHLLLALRWVPGMGWGTGLFYSFFQALGRNPLLGIRLLFI